MSSVAIVARLTVRRAALDTFRTFETAAAAIMAVHGGCITQTVVFDPDQSLPILDELHVVTFPDAQAYAAYRDDPALATLLPMRDDAVVATHVEVGVEGPTYEA